ncbi:SDR family NAD(P)-dependent oxidoreductase [Conexibacter sp. CPCC 206217]|uniref:SDR family NAD(P)-dependent oxidoreductase n=1 Tax=Conexibacter sp. CPCC 206217 TaxID=3064574 RepID=UPI0027247643|nr:SDR family oxidoreductase [Conexibacter sp. CPCC 206217]MDO8212064.1 SDR family oxidoreductase [Conexibacter sp. CPCC 206217]
MALVTAAGAGIGLAVVEALVREGARVCAADRDLARLAGIQAVDALEADLLAAGAGARIVEQTVERHGRVDLLVNCLGGPSGREDGFLALDDDAWGAAFERNFMGTVRATRAAIPHMQRQGGGSIVTIASDLARQPDPRFVDYAAAKAALLSLSKSLSIEFGPLIRANVVSPGPTRTPGLVAHFDDTVGPALGISGEEAMRRYVQEVRTMPSDRLGTPEEVANVVVFLASGAAAQATGSEWVVDGGVRKQA